MLKIYLILKFKRQIDFFKYCPVHFNIKTLIVIFRNKSAKINYNFQKILKTILLLRQGWASHPLGLLDTSRWPVSLASSMACNQLIVSCKIV